MTSSLHISQRYSIGDNVIAHDFDTYAIGEITEIVAITKTYIDMDGVHEYTMIEYSVFYSEWNHVHVADHDKIQVVATQKMN